MKERLMLEDQSDEQSNLVSELATKEKLIKEQRKEIEVAILIYSMQHIIIM